MPSQFSFSFEEYKANCRTKLASVCDYAYDPALEGAAALATLKAVCESCRCDSPAQRETAHLLLRCKLKLEMAQAAFTRANGEVQYITTALDPCGGAASSMVKPGLKNEMVAYAHAQLAAAISDAHFMTRIRSDEEREAAAYI